MIEELRGLWDEECDTYMFLPTEKNNHMYIQGSKYKIPGTKLNGTSMGDCYHIILFKEGDNGPIELDKFEGILGAPVEYMYTLITSHWYGVICKKTTTSETFANSVFDNLQKLC
jgi:hypothetical protein